MVLALMYKRQFSWNLIQIPCMHFIVIMSYYTPFKKRKVYFYSYVLPSVWKKYLSRFSQELLTTPTCFLCAASARGPIPRLPISHLYDTYSLFTDWVYFLTICGQMWNFSSLRNYWWHSLDVLCAASPRGPILHLMISHLFKAYLLIYFF